VPCSSRLIRSPIPCRRYPDVIARRTMGANEHGICHRRGLTVQPVTPIPDLRSDLDQPPVGSPQNRPPFQGFTSNFLSEHFLCTPISRISIFLLRLFMNVFPFAFVCFLFACSAHIQFVCLFVCLSNWLILGAKPRKSNDNYMTCSCLIITTILI